MVVSAFGMIDLAGFGMAEVNMPKSVVGISYGMSTGGQIMMWFGKSQEKPFFVKVEIGIKTKRRLLNPASILLQSIMDNLHA